jgi:O-antigen/teichoic acid export membrane protein
MNLGIRYRLRIGDFARNAGVLTIGTIGSQLIVLAFFPLLTRLYTPAEFGVVSVIYMTTSLLAVIASGAAEGAILIANSKRAAAHVIGWIAARSAIVLFIAFIGALILPHYIGNKLIEPSIQMWLPLVPFIAAPQLYTLIAFPSGL